MLLDISGLAHEYRHHATLLSARIGFLQGTLNKIGDATQREQLTERIQMLSDMRDEAERMVEQFESMNRG